MATVLKKAIRNGRLVHYYEDEDKDRLGGIAVPGSPARSSNWDNANNYKKKPVGKAPRPIKRSASKVESPTRMAGDIVNNDKFMAELKELSDKQVRDEMFEEEMNQLGILEAIHGKRELAAFLDPTNQSRTAEQQLSEGLLSGRTTNLDGYIPADRIEAGHMSSTMRGIDGEFQPDSEIRRHTTGKLNAAGDLDIDRSNVYTEILSPISDNILYEDWKDRGTFQKSGNNQDSRFHFNTAGAEYYGQQLLKTSGYQPVSDADRSFETKKAAAQGKPTSIGTDRLIENSRGLSDPDTSYSSDYRAVAPDGSVVAMDYQTGNLNYRDPQARLSIFKNLNFENDAQHNAFKDNMVLVAQNLKQEGKKFDLDSIFHEMMNRGMLPDYIKTGYLHPDGPPGLRAGKFLSNAEHMGSQNFNPQHRMEAIVYGLHPQGHRKNPQGMQPQDILVMRADSIRDQLGAHLAEGRFIGEDIGLAFDHKFDWQVPLKHIDAPVDRNHVRQIAEPYSFK